MTDELATGRVILVSSDVKSCFHCQIPVYPGVEVRFRMCAQGHMHPVHEACWDIVIDSWKELQLRVQDPDELPLPRFGAAGVAS